MKLEQLIDIMKNRYRTDEDRIIKEFKNLTIGKDNYDNCIYSFQLYFSSSYIGSDLIREQGIGGYPHKYTEDYLLFLVNLFEYSKLINDNDACMIIAYFINSLYYSLKYGDSYKEIREDVSYYKETFLKIIPPKSMHVGEYKDYSIQFAKNILVDYSNFGSSDRFVIHDIHIDLLRILSDYNEDELLEMCISNLVKKDDNYMLYTIGFDKNIATRLHQYFDYQVRLLFSNSKEHRILEKLNETKLIDKTMEQSIIGRMKEAVDLLAKFDGIERLHLCDTYLSDHSVINRLHGISSETKKQLKTVALKVNKIKRDAVKNFDFGEGKTFTHRFTVEELDSRKESFTKNPIVYIMQQTIIDFEKELTGFIENTTTFALTSLFKGQAIDIDNYLYIKDDDTTQNSFREYVTEIIMKEIESNYKNTTNIHVINYENAYLLYTKRLKENTVMGEGIVAHIIRYSLGDDYCKQIVSEYLYDYNRIFDNHQVLVATIIGSIEHKLIKLHNVVFNGKETDYNTRILEELFKEFLNTDSFRTNIILTFNFYLYDKNGRNLRNNMAHGNLKSGTRMDHVIIRLVGLLHLLDWLAREIGNSQTKGELENE